MSTIIVSLELTISSLSLTVILDASTFTSSSVKLLCISSPSLFIASLGCQSFQLPTWTSGKSLIFISWSWLPSIGSPSLTCIKPCCIISPSSVCISSQACPTYLVRSIRRWLTVYLPSTHSFSFWSIYWSANSSIQAFKDLFTTVSQT